jgi:hypothetical protein
MTIGVQHTMHRTTLAFVIAGVMGVCQAADLPADVRTSATAPAMAPAISKYVTDQLALVQTFGPRSAAAREELCRQPEATATISPSASFQTTYVAAIIDGIQPMLVKPDVTVRINAAIIVSRVANATKSPNLQPLILKLLADDSAAIALWGTKAAGALLPSVLGQPFLASNQKLTVGIKQAAEKHHASGALIQDAYKALTDIAVVTPALPPAAINTSTQAVLGLLEIRINDWMQRLPADPQADRAATAYLARNNVLTIMSPAQKLTTADRAMGLLSAAVQRAAVTDSAQRERIYNVAAAAAGTMQVLMIVDGQQALSQQFAQLTKLPGGLTPDAAITTVQTAHAAVKTLPAYAQLTALPQIQSAE